MLRRKIDESLLLWKNSKDHKPLIIKGLRQSGKTFSALRFAEKNYKSVIYINFQNNEDYKKIFDSNLEVDFLKVQISAFFSGAKFIDKDTIIILDEIQECSKARLALKFFKLDGRYDVIATGSLLGISGYSDDTTSVPVGYEEEIRMYPLDFEEFLWAKGISDDVINELKLCFNNKEKVPIAIHEKMKEILLQYIIIGGMPEVVNKFIETNNINESDSTKFNILKSFQDDMVKYASSSDKTKIKECFESIPYQLAKENKKFKYSFIRKKATRTSYIGVIEWLDSFGITQRCYNLSKLDLPLGGYADNEKFKIYLSDIGLLISMFGENINKDIISGNLNIYKGAIYENLFADFMIKKGKPLYYYHKDSNLEIDFVMRFNNKLTLIEVKATTGNSKSLKTILNDKKQYGVEQAIKLGDYNIGYVNNILTLPLYMGFLIS